MQRRERAACAGTQNTFLEAAVYTPVVIIDDKEPMNANTAQTAGALSHRIIIILTLMRLFCSLFGTGYVHPDEWFQAPEVSVELYCFILEPKHLHVGNVDSFVATLYATPTTVLILMKWGKVSARDVLGVSTVTLFTPN